MGDGRFIGREMEGPREALGYLSKLEDMRSIREDRIRLRYCSVSCNGPETSPGASKGHPEGVGAWNGLILVRIFVPVYEIITEGTEATVACSWCGWSRGRSFNLVC